MMAMQPRMTGHAQSFLRVDANGSAARSADVAREFDPKESGFPDRARASTRSATDSASGMASVAMGAIQLDVAAAGAMVGPDPVPVRQAEQKKQMGDGAIVSAGEVHPSPSVGDDKEVSQAVVADSPVTVSLQNGPATGKAMVRERNAVALAAEHDMSQLASSSAMAQRDAAVRATEPSGNAGSVT
jgi:hypothetical protein